MTESYVFKCLTFKKYEINKKNSIFSNFTHMFFEYALVVLLNSTFIDNKLF